MSLHELKKDTKIIHEFTLYLMRHGILKLNIDINKSGNTIDTIIKTEKCPKGLVDRIIERIGDVTESEYEEYGWELMGESDEASELELVGMLLNNFEVDNSNQDHTLFILRRVDRY